jgi:serine/threonine protein kinase/Tfp pilus assembly protein PilF
VKEVLLSVREHSAPQPGAPGGVVAPGTMTALLERLVEVPTAEAPPLLEPGVRAGRYEIIRRIGRGGFGSVYEAHDTVLHRLVALKVLHLPQVAGPASAAGEGEAAAQLAHPNIAALHDAGVVDGGFVYLVYEILHGETLESRLSRGPLPPAEAVAIGVQVARALAHAHAHGVVHRDLKPANVFLTADGDVKVLDFGMALLFGRDAPAGGTPAYMAPEQRRGEPEDARTDLFALGLLLVEMSTGERDTGGGTARAGVPPPLRPVTTALLAEDRALRPRSARAALLGLEAAARRLAPRRPRSRHLVAAAAAALAVGAAAVAAAIFGGRLERGPPVAHASVAVLPFTDLSPQRDQEYFSAGLAQEILDALAQVRGLRVAGRISSFALKGEDDLRTVGRKLGVRAVLEGSVRKSGDRVRITAQLVEVRGGYELWSRTFDRELRDVFAVQDEIAKAVVGALQVKLLAGDEPTTKAQRTSSPEAHTQYLLGRQLYARHTTDGYRRAAEAYEKAIALDPGYAAAHAWLGLALRDVAADDPASAAVLRRRAVAEVERAVVLGPDLPDAWAARGFLRIAWTHDWAGARSDLARALALNPSDSPARRRQGILLASLGRAEEAVPVLRQAIDLDPLDSTTWERLAYVEMSLGRFDAARDALRRALEISPGSDDALISLGYLDIVEGRPADAVAGTLRVREMERLEIRSMAEHDLRHAAEARRALDQLVARYGRSDAVGIAQVYAWWGERDHAFEWLDRALGQELFDVKFNPVLRKLRLDPRYAALLRRMDLPPD